jgi:beta-lactam-binding protein with PASTA domain/tRNA A-37 threonylcarbamoyl transferase component Bud32
MATVYVATDLRLERRVALKVMHSHLSDDAVFQSRFIQEARAAARLADPHVVNVFDQGQDGDMAYLVMEYLPGVTLRDLLREQRRLSIPKAVTIMDAVLSGLAAAHRAGIVHRDVKPENVLLAEDGRIKIGDFGLARATSANTASGQMLLGTIAYLAPELVTRGTADARSDIYALGIMLYEMLAGEQPYRGEQPMRIAYQHANDSVPRPSAKNPGVPEQLDELVLWATERSPDDRPVDAAAMLDRLREIERQLGIAPQVQRTLAVAGTAVLDTLDSDELTKVLPSSIGTGPITVADEDVDNAARLRRNAKRRTAKGGWLFVLVLALAALAAGVGWWFGSGPGSMIAVPKVVGDSYQQASARLVDAGLTAAEKDQYDLSAPSGTAIGTTPDTGARLKKATTVTVLISLGPAPQRIPTLTGERTATAAEQLKALSIRVARPYQAYFLDAPAGTVIGVTVTPRGGGDAVTCDEGCQVHRGDTATLSVSDGQVPSVTGLSVDAATTALTTKGLQVSPQQTSQYSDTVATGQVIGIADRDGGGHWRPNDTVTLIVSKGPQLYPVPNVVGMKRDQAKKALANAGFTASYSAFWDAVVNGVTTVTAQSPDPSKATCSSDGTQCAKGSVIDLTIGGSF